MNTSPPLPRHNPLPSDLLLITLTASSLGPELSIQVWGVDMQMAADLVITAVPQLCPDRTQTVFSHSSVSCISTGDSVPLLFS